MWDDLRINYYESSTPSNSTEESQSTSSSWTSDEELDRISTLTDTQDKVLALLPILPSLLSAWGSAQIIWMVWTGPKRSAYRRILLGLSCSDFISSLSLIWQPFLIPAETSHSLWAIGTDATCTAMGWFVQFGFCSVWYNMMLSIYFCLLVRFGVKDQVFQQKYESYLHLVCIGFPLVTATVGAIIGLYRESHIGDGCWITRYPEGCYDCDEEEIPFDEPDAVCCYTSRFGWSFGGVPTLMSFVIIVTNYLVVYCHVQRLVSLHDTVMSSRSPTRDPHVRRIRAVMSQCCLYVAAFLFCYMPPFCLRVMESLAFGSEDEAKLFPMLVVQAVTFPLQGLFNCLIYVRPTYLRVRQDFPNESKYWAFRRAMHGDRVQPTDDHRASSLVDAPAFSHVVLSPSQAQNKPSELGTGTSTSHASHGTSHDMTTNIDLSWSVSSRRRSNQGVEAPPAMPRRVDTQQSADELFDVDDFDLPNNQAPLFKGGFLVTLRSWKRKKSDDPPQPGDSNFVSSLKGSEFNCVDAVPVKPDRKESQLEGLPPIPAKMEEFISSELKHPQLCHDDRLPMAPVRETSSMEEHQELGLPPIPLKKKQFTSSESLDDDKAPRPPQRERSSIEKLPPATMKDEELDIEAAESSTRPHRKNPLKGFLLGLMIRKSDPHPKDSQFVSSLVVGSDFDFMDEAPVPPARVKSQAEVLPAPLPLKATQPLPSDFRTDDSPSLPTREISSVERLSPDTTAPPSEPSKPSKPPPPGRNTRRGFVLNLLGKKKSGEQNDSMSQFVSSLATGSGIEYFANDEAPTQPARIESQGESLAPPAHQSSLGLKHDDRSPVVPARARSSTEGRPIQPMRKRSEAEQFSDDEDISTTHMPVYEEELYQYDSESFVSSLPQDTTDEQIYDSQSFVSSLGEDTESDDCFDEAPELQGRIESQVEDPMPLQETENHCSSLGWQNEAGSSAAPAKGRSRSSWAERLPSMPRRLETETDDSIAS